MDTEKLTIPRRLEFVESGVSLKPMQGKIALDVGNRLCPGIIDHHQSGVGVECSTSLVIHHPNLVKDHLAGLSPEAVTFITHRHPDLDAVTAIYCAHYLLTYGELPPHSETIAKYMIDIDRGICFRYPDKVITIYSLFMAMSAASQQSLENDRENQIIEIGFKLWNYAIDRIEDETDLHNSDLFGPNHPFAEAEQSVIEDQQRYSNDISKGDIFQVWLPRRDGRPPELVDAISIIDPESMLFKCWARIDTITPKRRMGFTLLVVNYDNRRYVISTDPLKPFYLKGLGDMLEVEESLKRLKMGKERTGPPREGYDGPDPWYDGRNELHAYTIIDTPHSGTFLKSWEIISVILNYSNLVRTKQVTNRK